MAIGFLIKGTTVLIKNEQFKLIRQFEGGLWQIEHQHTGRIIELTMDELHKGLVNGETQIYADSEYSTRSKTSSVKHKNILWTNASEDQKKAARRKYSYVIGALALPKTASRLSEHIAKIIVTLNDASPPGPSSLRTWINRFIEGGNDIAALLSRQKKSGNRTARIEPEVEQLVDNGIDEFYLSIQRHTMEETRCRVEEIIQKKNQFSDGKKIKNPSLNYYNRRLNCLNAYDICAARYGSQFAARKYRNSTGHAAAERPLERVEIDHTPLNLIIIDSDTGMPLGRPYLTVALEKFSRCVHGYYLSFDPPGYSSVMQCLMHAILPKTYVKDKYPNILNGWDCYGVPSNLVVDNGLEFHSNALEDVALRFGITLQYCPRKQPWLKGSIERFLGTINRSLAHNIPGTTFANIVERGDYDPSKMAVMTMDAIQEILHQWVIDIYHRKPHRGLDNQLPSEIWKLNTVGMPIPLPTHIPDFEAAFAIPLPRTLTFKGIELFTLFYNCPECREYRIKKGSDLQVTIRYLPNNLGYIYIEMDDGQMMKVPVIKESSAYADGLTKWQHDVIRRFMLNNQQEEDRTSILHAKQRIREIVDDELRNKKRNLRKNAARFNQAEKKIKAKPSEPAAQPDTLMADDFPSVQPEVNPADYDKLKSEFIKRDKRK